MTEEERLAFLIKEKLANLELQHQLIELESGNEKHLAILRCIVAEQSQLREILNVLKEGVEKIKICGNAGNE